MSIASVGAAPPVGAVHAIDDRPRELQHEPIEPPPADEAAAHATISPPGALLSQLQDLSLQDPVKFRHVVDAMASELRTVALSSPDEIARGLATVATKLDEAAQTGFTPQLFPYPHGATAYRLSAHAHAAFDRAMR